MVSVGHLRWTGLRTRSALEIDVNHHVLRGDVVPHDHDFVEVAVVLDGLAWHETLYDRRRVGRGDAFVIRPAAWHAFRSCDRLSVVNCCFRASLLERELLWLAEEPRLRFLLWPGRGASDGVVRVRVPPAGLTRCEETLGELAEPPCEEPRAHQLAHLLLLLCGLARHLDSEQVADAERRATAPTGVAQALALMASDLARAWTVQELADAVAVSRAHLSRLFRDAVGRPPIAHLGVLRAEAAAARLLRTAEPVSAVGAAVGWGDPNYFARRFRAHFGTSPTAFRSRLSAAAPGWSGARR